MTQTTSANTTPPTSSPHTPDEVLAFWLGDGMASGWPTEDLDKRWFRGGAALDQDIRVRFGALVQLALQGRLQTWEPPLHSRLALALLLDQFTRNMFRGTAQAFEGDARAQALTLQTLDAHEDLQLPWVGRVFLYMPLMHAEDRDLQSKSVACFAKLMADAPAALKPKLQGHLDYARKHQGIIARFGRFPHRNEVLRRINTAVETEFLHTGPRFGQ